MGPRQSPRIKNGAVARILTLLSWFAALCIGCQAQVDEHHRVSAGDCSSCHIDEFHAATNPLHLGVMPETCESCHNEKFWSPAPGFIHSWPLTGSHQVAQCNSCHTGQPAVFAGTSQACVTCHSEDRAAVVAPDHSGFSDECSTCHTTQAWSPATFSGGENFVHPWPLEGAHANASCSNCHTGDPPRYEGTPTECVGCHADDRATVQSPDHATFPDDCTECHTNSGWKPAQVGPSFAHSWPLVGAHTTASCSSCHTGEPPRYEGTPTVCIGCHDGERNQAQPDHGGFSTNCLDCHTNVSWKPAGFNHQWPLTGAHQLAACGSCHTGDPPKYQGTPSACVDCHRDDYNASTFSGHNDFPTSCADCHSTAGWKPASGAHPNDKFPINGGPHGRYACGDCHKAELGPNGAGNTDCVNCHDGTHTRGRMDGEHREVGNYPRGDAPVNFCLDCHRNGRED